MAHPEYKAERIVVFGDAMRYAPDESGRIGMFIYNFGLKPDCNYFEVLIENIGVTGGIAIGLVSSKHPLDQYPGWVPDSIGYLSEGRLYKNTPKVIGVGPKFNCGDRLGCGLKFKIPATEDSQQNVATVFFTKNGKEIGTTVCSMPVGGLYPAVGLNAFGASLEFIGRSKWTPEEDMSMCIDSNEEEWSRLHDIKLNGAILEYAGRGKSIIDVGLAQAKYPLDTTHHYFEIEILDPGENCYIAIGLARKDYPKYRAPGWNKGSIAYHADDGKIFVGSGVGDPFGPRCYKGDIMGCGIMFPRDYVCYFDYDDSCENGSPSLNLEYEDDLSGSLSESEDEEWWKEKENVEAGVIHVIQVFFTRNGKTIGQKDVCIPKGGFYPTIGMLSSNEKVKVDLHPLTG